MDCLSRLTLFENIRDLPIKFLCIIVVDYRFISSYTPNHNNYTIRVNSKTYEDLGYDICTDFKEKTIRTSKLYGHDNTSYQVNLFGVRNQPQLKLNAFFFHLYWLNAEAGDLALQEAFKEVGQNRTAVVHIPFFEDGVLYETTPSEHIFARNLDPNAEISMLATIPDVECQRFGVNRLGRLDYSYRGYAYSKSRLDSVFIDNLDLTLYVPLTL